MATVWPMGMTPPLDASESSDNDGDGIGDNADADDDDDLLTDAEEAVFGTDPLQADTDGDGLTDFEEFFMGSDPLNAMPTVSSLEIDPAVPTAATTSFECLAGVIDADGDPLSVTYQWMLDGVLLSDSDSVLQDQFSIGEVVSCSVTVSDGQESSSDSVSVTIQNSPPTVSNVSITPSQPTTNETVTALATANDTDAGQSLTLHYIGM